MIVQILIFALVVKVLGLISMSIVTGEPLNKTFKNTRMMAVFFCTGVLLSLLAYSTMIAQTCQACNDRPYCKHRGCPYCKHNTDKPDDKLKLIKKLYTLQ